MVTAGFDADNFARKTRGEQNACDYSPESGAWWGRGANAVGRDGPRHRLGGVLLRTVIGGCAIGEAVSGQQDVRGHAHEQGKTGQKERRGVGMGIEHSVSYGKTRACFSLLVMFGVLCRRVCTP